MDLGMGVVMVVLGRGGGALVGGGEGGSAS